MERGVITLSQNQLASLFSLEQAGTQFPIELQKRLQSTPRDAIPETISLELSAETVDSLLDVLPPPPETSDPTLRELHALMTQFLQQLRGKQYIAILYLLVFLRTSQYTSLNQIFVSNHWHSCS
mgnify:CR=1 FL=1